MLVWCNKSKNIVEPNIIPESEWNGEALYDADSWKEIISEDCMHFFDGCNSCSRVEWEEWVAACTMMYCEVYEEPRCTDDETTEEPEIFWAEVLEEWGDEEVIVELEEGELE